MDMKEKKTGKGTTSRQIVEVQQMKDMEINEKIRYFRNREGYRRSCLQNEQELM